MQCAWWRYKNLTHNFCYRSKETIRISPEFWVYADSWHEIPTIWTFERWVFTNFNISLPLNGEKKGESERAREQLHQLLRGVIGNCSLFSEWENWRFSIEHTNLLNRMKVEENCTESMYSKLSISNKTNISQSQWILAFSKHIHIWIWFTE